MKTDGRYDFEDFLTQNPKYNKYSDNPVAKEIFTFMNELENINSMIIASTQDKPALSFIISNVENLYGNQKLFDLSDDFTKQAVGTMAKTILKPFGYEPFRQKRLSSKDSSKFFTSASVYRLNKVKQRVILVQQLYIQKIEDK